MTRKLVVFAVIVAILGATEGVIWSHTHQPTVRIDNRRVTSAAVGAELQPLPIVPANPVRVSIPAIGIDSRTVIPVGLNRRGAIDTACDSEKPYVACNVNATGWYTGSPRPGSAGDAIIDGHVDWYGPPPTLRPDVNAIFTNLHRAKVGDQVVVVDALGHSRVFAVDAVATLRYPKVPPELFAQTGTPSVTLITCAGVFASVATGLTERLYVHASLISGS